jgi:gluconolactonase
MKINFWLSIILTLLLNLNIKAQNDFQKIAEGLQFPEGPAWDGKDNLYLSSCYGGYIAKIVDSSYSILADSIKNKPLKQTNGLVVSKDGNIFACDYGIGAILKISPEGKTEIFVSGFNGVKFNRPNDLAFDPNGNLYFTDPKSYGPDKPDGRIFMVDKSGKVTLIEKGLHFPNGIAFSSDAENLFVSESALNRVLKYRVNEDGSLSGKETFVLLPNGDPDGLALDISGNLYVAHFGNGSIYIISPEGVVLDSIKTPGKKPSNLEFGESDYKTLFITEDVTNSVYKLRMENPGIKLFYSP